MTEAFSVTALGLAYGGKFVCRCEDSPQQKKVFVAGIAPGETGQVEILAEEKNLLRAKLLKVLTPSPARRQPPCPIYGKCGGCNLQYIDIPTQRAAKLEMVRTMLRFQGKLDLGDKVYLIGEDLPEFNYRRRITLHVDPKGVFGFYRTNSTEVVALKECLISNARINRSLPALHVIFPKLGAKICAVNLEDIDDNIFYVFQLREGAQLLESEIQLLKDTFQDFKVTRKAHTVLSHSHLRSAIDSPNAVGCFSQVNAAANQILIDTVVAITPAGAVTDLYAGAGNLSIPLARAGHAVTAVELDPQLVAYGKSRANEDHLKVTFKTGNCDSYVESVRLSPTVVLDPPRAGARNVVIHFDSTITKTIIYVSCDLPTLTRDLRDLVQRGYQVDEVAVLDMFPQTHHVETISVLRASGTTD
jgi:23S rRNA (uracil1939-C5)-methyltransferase